MKYRPEIDGLRALAVVPVILFHAGFELFRGGFVGVDVFFVISGYLITTILVEDIENERFSIANFYERRARRILPALFFVMIVCIPFAWIWMLPSQMEDFSQSLVAVSLFSSNILFLRESGYFDAAAGEKPLLHTWSLAVEEQYYVLFPIFLILVWRFGKSRVFWMIVVMAAISLLLSEWAWRNEPNANHYLTPTRAWELLAGSIAAFVVQKQGVKSNNGLALLGLGGVGFSIFFYSESTPFPSVYALVPVLGVVLLILYADKETFAAKILSTKVFVSVGLISYSAYLWHQPLFAFARIKLITEPSDFLLTALALSSLLLAYLSWRFVEAPFRKRNRISRRTIFFLSIIGLAAFSAFGLYGYVTSGFERHRSYLPFIAAESSVREVQDERLAAIRSGICQFNRMGEFTQIDEFLENWNCTDDDEGLKPTGIIITGDSHSADKAVSLRLNGFDTFQISGAACQLSEEYVSRDRGFCKKILRQAHSLARENEIRAIFLSNRFPEAELSLDYLESIFNYWGDLGKPVYLWAPMPNFQDQQEAFLRDVSPPSGPDFARERKFYEVLDKTNIPQNFHIIRTSDMWCSVDFEQGCLGFSSNKLLMADEDHLSVEGAKIFGKNVIQSRALKSLFSD